MDYGKYTVQIKRGLQTPLLLIHFVTTRCNLKCHHCFYWKELNKPGDMVFEEQAKMIRSLKHPLESAMLTGGETFLFKDIVELCEVYSKENHTKNINLTTNGFTPVFIRDKVAEILSKVNSNVHVQVSIDGIKEDHDKVRAMDGSFDKAIQTIKLLKELQNEHKNFSVNALTVISNKNYENLDRIMNIINELGIDHAFELIRGTDYFAVRPRLADVNPKTKNEYGLPKFNELDEIYEKLKGNYDKTHKRKNFLDLHRTIFLSKLKMSMDILKKQAPLMECQAGNLIGVVYPDGNVGVCELLETGDNIKNYDYDFAKAWNSEKMDKLREKVKGCFCTHGCFLQSTLYHSPSNYGKQVIKNKIGVL